ncbi:restriction endonuclease subunit S [Brevundimonas sp. BH3]|uniref:restriction endonuclease subunit S n=1 Tax=Brevundimonas sp. BH3 TaxID=3133089 RepID=UPI003254CA8E
MSREVPDGWSVKPLGKIADLIMGQSPPSSAVTEAGDGLPFIQGNAEFGARHPTPRFVASTTPKVVRAGDVLISVRAPVGEVNIAEGPLCIGRGVGGIRAKECEPDFLFYAVAGLSRTFSRLSQGSTFDAINGKELREIRILLPPLEEQRRIAEVLRSLDEAIGSSRAMAEAARKTSQTMRHELLGVTRDGDLGDIPAGWLIQPLEALATVERGKFSVRPRNDPRFFGGRTPFIQTGDITAAGDYLSSHTQTLNELGVTVSRVFPAGTIMTTIAANIGDFTISTYPVACPDSVVGIEPHDGVNVFWLYSVLSCFKVALDRAATQNAQKNINLQTLRPLLIPVPPPNLMTELSESLKAAADIARNANTNVRQLESLKIAVMDDLLSGRIRVPA